MFPVLKVYNGSLVLPLKVDGRLLKYSDGDIFRVKGVTAFKALKEFESGKDISWVFKTFPLANLWRIFWYTPQNEWGDKYWDLPSTQALIEFHKYLASNGIYVYNTCLTNAASDSKISQIKELIKSLSAERLSNCLLEAKNEPYVHDSLNPSILKNIISGSGYLYTSGIYDWDHIDSFWGTFGNNHVPRDDQSVRKFKDLEELYNKIKTAWFEGEPFKPGTGYPLSDFYTFAAGTSLMGSGGIFHCQSMENLDRPNTEEFEAARLFFNGLDTYPLDSQLGGYRHRDDLEGIVNNEPTTCLRCYQKGNYAIVVRPNEKFVPPSNWVSIDNYRVAWKII